MTQTMIFEVLEGTLAATLDGDEVAANAGDILVVEPGVAHTWWNGGEGVLRFRCEMRPALEIGVATTAVREESR